MKIRIQSLCLAIWILYSQTFNIFHSQGVGGRTAGATRLWAHPQVLAPFTKLSILPPASQLSIVKSGNPDHPPLTLFNGRIVLDEHICERDGGRMNMWNVLSFQDWNAFPGQYLLREPSKCTSWFFPGSKTIIVHSNNHGYSDNYYTTGTLIVIYTNYYSC